MFQLSQIILTWGFVFLSLPASAREIIGGRTMGTSYRIVYEQNEVPSLNKRDLRTQLDGLLEKLNQEVSHYIADSDISGFNRTKANQAVSIPKDFATILSFSLDLAKKTDGVFDPTIGPLLALFGFGPKRSQKETLATVKKKVGFRKISLNQEKGSANLSKLESGVELDLSATAKGFGVDKLFEAMQKRGFRNYLVEIGGELRATKQKPDGKLWEVGIETPSSFGRRVRLKIALSNLAIATSGNYRNFKVDSNKRRVGHIFNPKTQQSVKTRVGSVSVISDTCLQADGWATALLAMGEKAGIQLAEKKQLKAVFLVFDGQQFQVKKTKAFAAYETKYKGKR